MSKVVGNVVTQELFQYYEEYSKLYLGQMRGQKARSAIDAVIIQVHTVQENWEEKKLASAFCMDIKGAFDNILKEPLLTRMIQLRVDGDLIS